MSTTNHEKIARIDESTTQHQEQIKLAKMQLLGLWMTPEEQATVKEYESEVGKSLANIEKTSEEVHEFLKNEAIFSEQLTESTVALKNTDKLLKEADGLKKTLPNPQHSAFRP